MTRTFERRVFPLTEAKIMRADDKTGTLRFTGRPWVYGRMSEDLGGWQEVIDGGAAARTLQNEPDVRFLINHDSNLLLARTTSGTLQLSEDDDGGVADAQMANVTYARDLAELLERGDMNQMSFGFWVTADTWEGNLHRVREFDLDGGDVSAVTFPAYPQTSAAVRSYVQRNLGIDPDALAAAPIIDVTPEGVRGFLESLHDEEGQRLIDAFPELRIGKMLSSGNEQLIRDAVEVLSALLKKNTKTAEVEDRSLPAGLARHRLHELELLSQI